MHNVLVKLFHHGIYTHEYKMMGQGASLGQLYDEQNEIKTSKKHLLGLCIYYTYHNDPRVLYPELFTMVNITASL